MSKRNWFGVVTLLTCFSLFGCMSEEEAQAVQQDEAADETVAESSEALTIHLGHSGEQCVQKCESQCKGKGQSHTMCVAGCPTHCKLEK